jgi:hypothetical protein
MRGSTGAGHTGPEATHEIDFSFPLWTSLLQAKSIRFPRTVPDVNQALGNTQKPVEKKEDIKNL